MKNNRTIKTPAAGLPRMMTALLFVLLTAASCVKEKPEKPPVNALSGVNKWIYETLEGWYYWNDTVKAAALPENSLEYDDFLETLVMSLRGAEDKSENPYTIDGGYYSDGTRHPYPYSNIRRTGTTRATDGEETTFGFDVIPVYNVVASDPERYWLLVTWVQPGSPADEAGIVRGMWITQYAGKSIYWLDYAVTFANQLYNLEGGTSMALTDKGGKPYNLTAVPTKVDPIFVHKVITSPGGKKVAYLYYNEFEPGKTGRGSTGEFDDRLRDVFAEFKGATELVLDLRYNPGGYVNSCQILTSLAADVDKSRVFAKLQRNKDINKVYKGVANPEVKNFFDESNSLKLKRVYVLATEFSASASEMVINALRGAGIDVVHIGDTTEGKNVGMDVRTTTIDGYAYEMLPITFKITNADGFCDYAGGFKPDYYQDEFRDALNSKNGRDLLQFGDPEERLLAAALTLVDGGSLTPDPATRSAEGGAGIGKPAKPLRNPYRGGAKYIPEL